MGTRQRSFSVPVSQRADGEPWQLRWIEIVGSVSGPVTAFVSGVFGDKPLGTMALWALARRLSDETGLRGTVLLWPAANPFALEAGTRISPDHLYLNRVFPGAPRGALTMQIAHHLLEALRNSTDCVVDLHSGTPDMALWYSYDYGDEQLSASFGYTPVITGMAQPGQLSKAFVDGGGKSVLVEFGGGALGDLEVGVEGCLNVLRYRGQLGGRVTGPGRVPVIDRDISLFIPSHTGVLTTRHATSLVGQPITRGPVAGLACPATGQELEEFAAERDGALLLLARTSPAMVSAGDFGAGVGYPAREIRVIAP